MTVRFKPPAFDIDGDGSAEQFVFEYEDNLDLSFPIRTGYLTGESGRGSSSLDLLTDFIEDQTGTEIEREGRRQSLFTDLGGGARAVETTGDINTGTDLQWGTGDGDPVWDATGASALTKIQLLQEVLTRAEIDSRPADGNYPEGHLATLSVGEYSADGRWSPLEVVPEQPSGRRDGTRDASTSTVTLNFVTAASLDGLFDAVDQSDA